MSQKSFSAGVKNELAKKYAPDRKGLKAELCALLNTGAKIENSPWRIQFQTEQQSIIKKVFTLVEKLYKIKMTVSVRTGWQHKWVQYIAVLSEPSAVHHILTELGLVSGSDYIRRIPAEWAGGSGAQAYIRGAFLGSGSLTNPQKNYHAELINVSRDHQEALQELISRGRIKREQGRGTYVLHATIDYGMDDLMSITRLLEMHGAVASTKDVEIVIGSASAEDAESLNISELEPVYTINRTRCADGVPVVYDSVVIPCRYLPTPNREDLEGSLFEILDKSGVHITQGAGRVSIQTATDKVSEKMSLNKQQPLLCMFNVLYDQNGMPVMVARDYYTNRIQFPIRRTRKDYI